MENVGYKYLSEQMKHDTNIMLFMAHVAVTEASNYIK